jgi:hypothetical protein
MFMNNPKSHAGLVNAIFQAIAYADVFDYPLSTTEVHRYLVGLRATRDEVEKALGSIQSLSRIDRYFTLREREALFDLRRRRERNAAKLWLQASRYGRAIANLPFIRMVAVTGSLAMRNVDENADIDYLIVTEPGRLWFCRAMVLFVGRVAAMRGIHLCPNYLITMRTLVFPDKNLYSAHEIAQMVPLSGLEVYHLLRKQNDWMLSFLPNAGGTPSQDHAYKSPIQRSLAHPWLEKVLRSAPFTFLERWEMDRKIRQLTQEQGSSPESEFSADICKGHAHLHQARIQVALRERLKSLQQEFNL